MQVMFIRANAVIRMFSCATIITDNSHFTFSQICQFVDRLNAIVEQNEIPVRLEQVTEEDLYLFHENVYADGKLVKQKLINAYSLERHAMSVYRYRHSDFVCYIYKIIRPLGINKYCIEVAEDIFKFGF